MFTMSIRDMEKSIIPVSRFNKGEASKIFAELQTDGVKAVFKNNKREAVIMSPQVYDQLMDMLEDQLLIMETEKRLTVKNPRYYSLDEVMQMHGVTEEMLEAVDEEKIDFE